MLFGLDRGDSIASPCFISHSYKDTDVRRVIQALPRGVRPIVFPPIDLSPSEFVSEHLIAALDRAKSVLVVDSPSSRQSFWVAFERHYAMQRRKRLFRYDSETNSIRLDDEPVRDLPIFASFQHRDEIVVKAVLTWLRKKRGFEFKYHPAMDNSFEDLEREDRLGISDNSEGVLRPMERIWAKGGYVVAFLSDGKNMWWVKHDMELAIEFGGDRLFVACLGRPEDVMPPDILEALGGARSNKIIDLEVTPNFKPRRGLGQQDTGLRLKHLNRNRVDDLMVRVLYMIYQETTRCN